MPFATAEIVPPGSLVMVSMSTVPLQPLPATLHVPCSRYENRMFPTRVFAAVSKSGLIVKQREVDPERVARVTRRSRRDALRHPLDDAQRDGRA